MQQKECTTKCFKLNKPTMATEKEIQDRYAAMSNVRQEGESFDDYKERRRETNRFIKQYLKGRRL